MGDQFQNSTPRTERLRYLDGIQGVGKWTGTNLNVVTEAVLQRHKAYLKTYSLLRKVITGTLNRNSSRNVGRGLSTKWFCMFLLRSHLILKSRFRKSDVLNYIWVVLQQNIKNKSSSYCKLIILISKL